MNEKATIYDYARMCKSYGENCKPCPFYDKECELGDMSNEELQEANEIILKWCKEHPIETRQDRFLKLFPNAVLNLGVISVCPCVVDTKLYKGADNYDCYRSKGYENCLQCYKEYWLAEVDE